MCRRFPLLGFDPIGGDRGTFGTGVGGDAGPFWHPRRRREARRGRPVIGSCHPETVVWSVTASWAPKLGSMGARGYEAGSALRIETNEYGGAISCLQK